MIAIHSEMKLEEKSITITNICVIVNHYGIVEVCRDLMSTPAS